MDGLSASIPLIMGILNVTPDSFSDGGRFDKPETAIAQIKQLIEHGADIIDCGAESTRPKSTAVSTEIQLSRLHPVFEFVAAHPKVASFSIDTRDADVARAALDRGFSWVNTIGNKFLDDDLRSFLDLCPKVSVVFTHIHGEPEFMQVSPLDAADVISDVSNFFEGTYSRLRSIGYGDQQILLDPGFGFGKTPSANLRLIGALAHWSQQYQLAIGVSRKSFLEHCFGFSDSESRDKASKLAESILALASPIKLIRTHNPANLSQTVRYETIKGGRRV